MHSLASAIMRTTSAIQMYLRSQINYILLIGPWRSTREAVGLSNRQVSFSLIHSLAYLNRRLAIVGLQTLFMLLSAWTEVF